MPPEAEGPAGHAGHAVEAVKPFFTMDPPSAHDMMFVIWTWVALLLVIVVAAAARKDIGIIPRRWAGVFEHIYDWIADLAHGMMGKEGMRYVPFVMTIFLFVLASNWLALLPLPVLGPAEGEAAKYSIVVFSHPIHFFSWEFHEFQLEAPTGNLHTTLALALISFVAFNFYGLRKHYEMARAGHGHEHDHGPAAGGHDHHHEAPTRDPITAMFAGFFTWLAHFIEPTPTLWKSLEAPMKYFLVPPLLVLFIGLNIIEEFARIISLTIRLFGNIFGEHQVKFWLFVAMGMFAGGALASAQSAAIAGVAGNALLAVLLWGSSVFVTLIGTLAGFIQAFIFMVLTLSYIAHAVATEH